MQTEPDDIHAIIAELIELDSVFRKLSPNIRLLIEKLICLRCIDENIVTANAIVNNPTVTRESVELMAEHFGPLTNEQISLRNGALSEYFLAKHVVSSVSDKTSGAMIPLFKANSMLRLYRNFYDDWIDAVDGRASGPRERLSVWPDIYPFAEPSVPLKNQKLLLLLYTCYNPLAAMLGFPYSRGTEGASTIGLRDDLFQIVLNKRLGKEVSLKARAYSEEYIVDIENKKIFSPGPDGKPGTKDDIKLPINPEVLGWNTR